MEEVASKKYHIDLPVRKILIGGYYYILTSCVFASFMISSKLRQLSSLRIGSLSSYPTWLSVAIRIRIVSAAANISA